MWTDNTWSTIVQLGNEIDEERAQCIIRNIFIYKLKNYFYISGSTDIDIEIRVVWTITLLLSLFL
jgi:hypothetical protein